MNFFASGNTWAARHEMAVQTALPPIVTLQPDLETVERWPKQMVLQSRDQAIYANPLSVYIVPSLCLYYV